MEVDHGIGRWQAMEFSMFLQFGDPFECKHPPLTLTPVNTSGRSVWQLWGTKYITKTLFEQEKQAGCLLEARFGISKWILQGQQLSWVCINKDSDLEYNIHQYWKMIQKGLLENVWWDFNRLCLQTGNEVSRWSFLEQHWFLEGDDLLSQVNKDEEMMIWLVCFLFGDRFHDEILSEKSSTAMPQDLPPDQAAWVWGSGAICASVRVLFSFAGSKNNMFLKDVQSLGFWKVLVLVQHMVSWMTFPFLGFLGACLFLGPDTSRTIVMMTRPTPGSRHCDGLRSVGLGNNCWDDLRLSGFHMFSDFGLNQN